MAAITLRGIQGFYPSSAGLWARWEWEVGWVGSRRRTLGPWGGGLRGRGRLGCWYSGFRAPQLPCPPPLGSEAETAAVGRSL